MQDQRESLGPRLDARDAEVDALMSLATRLLRDRGPQAALCAAVDTMHERLGVAAAGRLLDPRGPSDLYERGIEPEMRWVADGAIAHGRVMAASAPGASGAVATSVTVADAGAIRLIVLDDAQSTIRMLGRVVMLVAAALDDRGIDAPAAPDAWMGLAWTAHEIRGPLVGVSAAIENVLSEEEDRESTDLLRRSREELERLAELVDPLLRLSPASGHLDARRVDLVGVVDHLVASPEFEAGRDRMVVASAGRIIASIDEAQITIAIRNLLQNAFAYSPHDAAVVVAVAARDGKALVSVLDGGPGIAPADVDALFEPYTRGSANGPTQQGSGLGLFIARTVVEAHGGSIGYEPWPGGSIFTIELPLQRREREASES